MQGVEQYLDYIPDPLNLLPQVRETMDTHVAPNAIRLAPGIKRTWLSLVKEEMKCIPWLDTLAQQLEQKFNVSIGRVFINQYRHGQSMIPHIDPDCRGPVILIVSLGDTGQLRFEPDHVTFECPSGSLIKMSDYARTVPTHEVLPLQGQERFSICFTRS